jgi:hypothetical protein
MARNASRYAKFQPRCQAKSAHFSARAEFVECAQSRATPCIAPDQVGWYKVCAAIQVTAIGPAIAGKRIECDLPSAAIRFAHNATNTGDDFGRDK